MALEKPSANCPVEVAVKATKAVSEAARAFEQKIAQLSSGTRGQAVSTLFQK